MDFKTKRMYKSNAGFYITLGYIELLVGVLTFIYILASITNPNHTDEIMTSLYLFVASFTAGFIFITMGMSRINKRQFYKQKMLMYKQYRYFHLINDQLNLKNYNEVTSLFNNTHLLTDENLRNLLLPRIITEFTHAVDPTIKAIGEEKLNKMFSILHPNTIKF